MDLANKGQRGFVLSRTGSSYQNPDEVYPAGPWSGHTSTLAFTGDTWGTWNTLAFQAQLSADEASIDEPYVSNDIGSFLGPPPGNPQDDADLYARWVQLGTFQPVLRLHSSARQPAALGLPGAGRRRRRQLPAPARGARPLHLHAGRPGRPAPACRSPSPLYLDYPGQADGVRQPRRVPLRPGHARRPGDDAGQRRHASRSGSRPGRGPTGSPAPRSRARRPRRSPCPSTGCRSSSRRAASSPSRRRWTTSARSPGAPLTLRVYPGRSGRVHPLPGRGQRHRLPEGPVQPHPDQRRAQAAHGSVSHRRHRPGSRGSYPGQPGTRSFGSTWSASAARGRSCSTGGRSPPATGPTTRDPHRDVTVPAWPPRRAPRSPRSAAPASPRPSRPPST